MSTSLSAPVTLRVTYSPGVSGGSSDSPAGGVTGVSDGEALGEDTAVGEGSEGDGESAGDPGEEEMFGCALGEGLFVRGGADSPPFSAVGETEDEAVARGGEEFSPTAGSGCAE